MKLFTAGQFANHVDDFNKADANCRPTETAWSGYTVFPLKQPKLRLTTKQPQLQPQDLVNKFRFTADQLLIAPPPGLTLPITQPPQPPKHLQPQPEPTEARATERDSTDVTTDALPHEPSTQARTPKTLPTPTAPSSTEVLLHNLTHLPYRTWCKHCVQGKGKEQQHRKLTSRTPTVQLD